MVKIIYTIIIISVVAYSLNQFMLVKGLTFGPMPF